MKIKRFIAPDMRQALQRVREEQGPEAVILSSRNLADGAEVVAAVDYDESLMMQAAGPLAMARNSTDSAIDGNKKKPPDGGEPRSSAAAVVQARPIAVTAVPAPAVATAAPSAMGDSAEHRAMVSMRQELSSMRQMIERQMGQLQEDRLRGSPVRAQLLDELEARGVESEHARSAVACVPTDKPLDRARGQVLGLLAKSLVATTFDPMDRGGVVALVGPTGAGKTTTLAKLAALYASRHSRRDVALVSADNHRVGACEQLQHYGRMLAMPVFESAGRARLHETLQRLDEYRLILVDCAGLAPGDSAVSQQLSWLRDQRQVSRLLVLPAHLQPCDLDRMIDGFDANGECSVVLTKLDEASSLGGAISVAIRRRLSLAYFCDGQRVPEDIRSAEPHRLLLKLGRAPRQVVPTQVQEHHHAVG